MPSLLETACALQHNLVQALPPHPHPHPLALASTSPLESIAHLRQTVQRTVRQLRAGLAQFPAAAGGADRYLTQLKDAAASEAQLVALWGRDLKPRQKRTTARHQDDERERYRVPTPCRSSTGREITTLQVLEHIASDLNLVTFRDHDDQDDDDDATTPVTLSLGGKLMVVDVTASSARSHHIQRVKVAYVVKGLDKLSILAATRLEHLFATSDEEDEEDVDVREEREQARWKGIRRILSELKDLDEMADRTGRDTFQELELLNANLEKAFSHNKKDDNRAEPAGASATSMIPAKDRLLLQPRDSLYPIVIYHGTPFAQLGRHWARLLSSSSSSSSLSRFEIMEALLGECGGGGDPPAVGPRRRSAGGNNNNNIYAVQLELGPPPLPAVPEAEPESQQSPPPTTTTTTTAAKEEVDRPAGSSSLFLARLIPSGVPILPETGRAVLKAALGFGTSGSGSGSGNGGGAGAAVGSRAATGGGGGISQDDGRGARPLDVDDDDAAKEEGGADGGERSTRRRKRTAMAWMRAVTLLRSDGQAVNDDAQGITYEQALPPSTTTISRPLLLCYQLPTTSSPSSSADNTAASTGCYEASYLAFRSVPHLVAALEILARQTRLNELLQSVVDERYGCSSVVVAAVPSPSAHGHGDGHGQGGGERHRVKTMMSLDDLFTPPSADTPLVVPISVGTGAGTSSSSSSSPLASTSASPPPPPPPAPPTFSLSFPFPALEAAPPNLLGLPLSLHFSLPPLVDNSTLPSASSSSSRSVADAAEEEEEELMITTNLVAPDEVVRSLLGGEEARRELDTRVGRVVRETGVVGLAVEEVIRTLSRAVTGMVDQPE